MTMDSITKGLLKAWKTSTWWAIAMLATIILAFSLTPGVSLGGLATFGLFLVALQALEFTKEQSKEWRRRSIENMSDEIRANYYQVAHQIFTMYITSKQIIDGNSATSIKKLNNDQFQQAITLTRRLKTINTHLKAIDEDGIDYVTDAIEKAIGLSSYNKLDLERYEKERLFKSAVDDFMSAMESFSIRFTKRHGKADPGEINIMKFMHYIDYIHEIGIRK